MATYAVICEYKPGHFITGRDHTRDEGLKLHQELRDAEAEADLLARRNPTFSALVVQVLSRTKVGTSIEREPVADAATLRARDPDISF